MKITADYHTHTIYSHGKGTIRDNVEEAIRKGLKEIAICDHGPGHYLYGVKKEKLYKMREEIDKLNEEYKDIKILLGLEANIIGYDGEIDVDDDIIEILDILQLGFHYGVLFTSLFDFVFMNIISTMSKILPFFRQTIINRNTNAMVKAIKRYPVDIITHPSDKVSLDIKKLAEAAYKNNVALEINAKHKQLSVENIKIALDSKVKFCLGSDAHKAEDVGEVEKAIERANMAEVPDHRIINLETKS